MCRIQKVESNTYSASPATVDFLVLLERNFNSIVEENLSKRTRTDIKDMSTVSPYTKKKIQREILGTVYGKNVRTEPVSLIFLFHIVYHTVRMGKKTMKNSGT